MGKKGAHKTRQTCPEEENIPVLITVETHSVTETGEVSFGTGMETGTGCDMLSKASYSIMGFTWSIWNADESLEGGNSTCIREVGELRLLIKKPSERDDNIVLWSNVQDQGK